ncbi:hypothetical protein Tco_1346163 [Tanacetum coccineum]
MRGASTARNRESPIMQVKSTRGLRYGQLRATFLDVRFRLCQITSPALEVESESEMRGSGKTCESLALGRVSYEGG